MLRFPKRFRRTLRSLFACGSTQEPEMLRFPKRFRRTLRSRLACGNTQEPEMLRFSKRFRRTLRSRFACGSTQEPFDHTGTGPAVSLQICTVLKNMPRHHQLYSPQSGITRQVIQHNSPRYPERSTSHPAQLSPLSGMTLHVILNLFQNSLPFRPSSGADSVPTFAIGGQACLHQKTLHNITACPAPLLKAPLGGHSLITCRCNE